MLSSASTLFFGFDKGCSVYFGPAANLYEIFGATGRSHSSKYVIVTVFIVGINHNRDGSLGNLEDEKEIDKGGTESSESQRASTASATPSILAPALSLTDTYVSTGAASTAASAPAAPSSPASESSIFLIQRWTSTDTQSRPRTSLCLCESSKARNMEDRRCPACLRCSSSTRCLLPPAS